ncbi:MAG: hypothetical protein HC795_00550 [Coleofasciculaceae cyanobacterium RL_1_1]|nr:hypothetical protein [Coleofasciculaceae cyanobacterium RL_1_1]
MTTDSPTPETPIASSPETDSSDPSNDIEIIDVRATDADAPSAIDDDEVRQKFAELIEAIERRAKAEAGNVSDWRVQAVEKAKETIEQTEQFARERQTQLEESVKSLQDEAFERWTELTKEAEDFTNRLQKAANEAWKIVTKHEEEAKATETVAEDPTPSDNDDSKAA